MYKKIVITASLLTLIGVFLFSQVLFSGQEETAMPTMKTVVVCKQFVLSTECNIDQGSELFYSLEDAVEVLTPLGGGTILINPGVYEAAVVLEGEWTLRGLEYPAAVTLLPTKRGSLLDAEFTDEVPGIIEVSENSTLTLENITLADNLTIFELPVGQEVVSGLVVHGKTPGSGGKAILNNVVFSSFAAYAVAIHRDAELSMQNSEFQCPFSSLLFNVEVMFLGDVSSYQSRYDHCNIRTWPFSSYVFDTDVFRNSFSSFRGDVVLKNSLVEGTENEYRTSLDYFPQFIISGQVVLENNVFINRQIFEVIDPRAITSLAMRDGPHIVQNNEFIGFDKAVLIEVGLDASKITFTNNSFRNNSILIELLNNLRHPIELDLTQNTFLNSDCVINTLAGVELVTITGSSNTNENNQDTTCGNEIKLPDGFFETEAE